MVSVNGGDVSDDDDTEVPEVEEKLLFEDGGHQAHVLQSLDTMRKNKTFCDVILHVRNTEMYGHRAVLASISPQLMELFSMEDEEKNGKQQGQVITFKLNGAFEASIVEKLIHYAYTSRLELQGCEVRSTYLAACYLKMDRVAKECAKYLIEHLTTENCIDIRSLPGISKEKSFASQLDEFILSQFSIIRETSSFLCLPCAQIEVLSQTRQEMSLVSCESLLQLVIDWIKRIYGDKKSSVAVTYESFIEKKHMLYLALDNSLQDCTQLPTGDISDTQIVQDYKKLCKKSAPSVQNTQTTNIQLHPAKPRVLIYDQEKAGFSKQDSESDWSIIAADKVGEHTFLALVLLDDHLTRISVMLLLNTSQDTLLSSPFQSHLSSQESIPDMYCALANMTAGKCAAGCATLNNSLLVCGGYDRVECIKSVESYNAEHNVWESLTPMLEARGRFGVAVVEGNVYAVGGCDGITELSTVECYDPKSSKWTRLADLPLARSNAGVCELSGKIYCIGGWNGQVGIKQCDVYDPITKIWTSIASLLTGRYQAGVCSFNGLVYAAGGCDSWNCLNSVECYNPENNSWSYIKPLLTARRGCGLIVFKGKLYAVGGSDGSHSLNSTEIYDPKTGEWHLGPSITTPRANVGVAVLGERLYAVGGFSGKKFLNSIEFLDESTNKWTHFSPIMVSTSNVITGGDSTEALNSGYDS